MYNYLNFMIEVTDKYAFYLKAVNELNNLSDNDLDVLGLTRYEIPTKTYLSIFANK
jgi:uncharacterized protein YjiS (DUF1127 family)